MKNQKIRQLLLESRRECSSAWTRFPNSPDPVKTTLFIFLLPRFLQKFCVNTTTLILGFLFFFFLRKPMCCFSLSINPSLSLNRSNWRLQRLDDKQSGEKEGLTVLNPIRESAVHESRLKYKTSRQKNVQQCVHFRFLHPRRCGHSRGWRWS